MDIKKTSLYYDSTSAIAITTNLVLHSRTKHIEVKYHFIREYIQNEKINIQYCSTKQLRNLFTKSLAFDWFSKLRFELGLIPNLFLE